MFPACHLFTGDENDDEDDGDEDDEDDGDASGSGHRRRKEQRGGNRSKRSEYEILKLHKRTDKAMLQVRVLAGCGFYRPLDHHTLVHVTMWLQLFCKEQQQAQAELVAGWVPILEWGKAGLCKLQSSICWQLFAAE